MTRALPYLVALVTILAATVLLQGVAHEPAVPLRQQLQASFPENLGAWEGETEFFEPGILASLGVDDYLLRRYQPPSGRPLWLYVGYWSSQRFGDRVHSPAVCLPGAGWVIADSRAVSIPAAGKMITVNRALVEKGDQRQLVLYWYQIHGRVAAREWQAISLLAWTSLTQRRDDEALVRINAPMLGTLEDTLRREQAFVQTAFPLLSRLLPE